MPFDRVHLESLYAKDPKLKKEDVEILKKWLETQQHLPKFEETQLIWALHRSSYNIESAKNRLDHFFTVRTKNPELTTPMSLEALRTAVNVQFIRFLPKRTPDNDVVVMLKLLNPKPKNFSFAQFMILLDMVMTLHLHQNGFEDGAVLLADPGAASFGHLFRLNFGVFRHCLSQMQKGTPIKIKGIHVINSFPFLDKVLFLLKPFLTKKLYNMIYFHSPGSESLYEKIPKEILPKEYGGPLPSIDVLNNQNLENLTINYDFFTWYETLKVDESKRTFKS